MFPGLRPDALSRYSFPSEKSTLSKRFLPSRTIPTCPTAFRCPQLTANHRRTRCTDGGLRNRCQSTPHPLRLPAVVLPYWCHQDKSKLEQECTRLVLAREQKKSVIDQYQTHATDTGSPEVQIAIISERIGQLTDHFKTHQKDHGSRRGLLMLVSKRRRLLDYLKTYDSERYKDVIQKLGIRK